MLDVEKPNGTITEDGGMTGAGIVVEILEALQQAPVKTGVSKEEGARSV